MRPHKEDYPIPNSRNGLFYGFLSGIPVHVIKLSNNWLTRATGILSHSKMSDIIATRIQLLWREVPTLIFWSLIGSRRNIFCTVLQLVVTPPSDISKMTGLMDLELSFTSLHDNIPSEFFLIKDLCYLGIFYPRIHGPISAKLEKCTRSNTSPLNCCSLLHGFYDFQGNSPVLVGFTHILILMLKGLTKYLSSCQVYFSCKIPPMSLHDISNPVPPSSYLHDYYTWFIKKN